MAVKTIHTRLLLLLGCIFAATSLTAQSIQKTIPVAVGEKAAAVGRVIAIRDSQTIESSRESSAFLFSYQGQVLIVGTMPIVLHEMKQMVVEFDNGARVAIERLYYAQYYELFLGIPRLVAGTLPTPLELDSSESVAHEIYFTGGPYTLEQRLVKGTVVNRTDVLQRINRTDLINQDNAPILIASTGEDATDYFSGGAVLNSTGKVVGVHLIKLRQKQINDVVKIFLSVHELLNYLSTDWQKELKSFDEYRQEWDQALSEAWEKWQANQKQLEEMKQNILGYKEDSSITFAREYLEAALTLYMSRDNAYGVDSAHAEPSTELLIRLALLKQAQNRLFSYARASIDAHHTLFHAGRCDGCILEKQFLDERVFYLSIVTSIELNLQRLETAPRHFADFLLAEGAIEEVAYSHLLLADSAPVIKWMDKLQTLQVNIRCKHLANRIKQDFDIAYGSAADIEKIQTFVDKWAD